MSCQRSIELVVCEDTSGQAGKVEDWLGFLGGLCLALRLVLLLTIRFRSYRRTSSCYRGSELVVWEDTGQAAGLDLHHQLPASQRHYQQVSCQGDLLRERTGRFRGLGAFCRKLGVCRGGLDEGTRVLPDAAAFITEGERRPPVWWEAPPHSQPVSFDMIALVIYSCTSEPVVSESKAWKGWLTVNRKDFADSV
ncbi:hypothetical protein BaRGS_00019339 [Batillaria attramentaria]|uniref:Uncharacterized protein n=1 Tax=Batillaria attramentaria TaxID=370345 RepID=A0ABD0KQK8_9CAEN